MHAWQMDCLTFTDLIYKTSDSKDVMYIYVIHLSLITRIIMIIIITDYVSLFYTKKYIEFEFKNLVSISLPSTL